MTMMNPRLFLLIACALLAGCLPKSKNPIAPPSQTILDVRLEGLWEAKEENGSRVRYYFHWRKPTPPSWLRVTAVSSSKDAGLKIVRYDALAARIGRNTYLSFRELSGRPSADSADFSFALYGFTWLGDLRIWLVNENALAEAVESGRLRGKVTRSKSGANVELTDSSAHIAAFVGASDPAKLFAGKPMVFHKLR